MNVDGSAVCNYVHVINVVFAVHRFFDVSILGYRRVYNIGSGVGVGMADVVHAVYIAFDMPVSVV
jgi:UDP-glucose 4-epimerase